MSRWLQFVCVFGCLVALTVGCTDQGSLSTEPTPQPAEADKEALMKQYSSPGKQAPPASSQPLPGATTAPTP